MLYVVLASGASQKKRRHQPSPEVPRPTEKTPKVRTSTGRIDRNGTSKGGSEVFDSGRFEAPIYRLSVQQLPCEELWAIPDFGW